MKRKTIISQSPGRINIIGEHTDYNDGYVLPAAIDKKTIFHLSINGTKGEVNIFAKNVNAQYSFNLNSCQPIDVGWENYIMGVVFELHKLGGRLQGFDGHFEGDIPIGGGMSSSASLECSLAFGLNELFDLGLSKWQIIKACQMAEHNFVGIQCGIMDQFASVMGKKDQLMLLDCRSLEFKYIPFDLGPYQLLLLHTNVSHELATSAYNTRRKECAEGVRIAQKQYPNISSLRDIDLAKLESLNSDMSTKVYQRCKHVVHENNRVIEATAALQKKDFKALGELIYQSHWSLSADFQVSCPELDFLVKLTSDKDYILGSRMMGGGFGGCTINIIQQTEVRNFIHLASKAYKKKYNIDLSPYSVSISDGAKIVDK